MGDCHTIPVFTPPPLPAGLNPVIANSLLTHAIFRSLATSYSTHTWEKLGFDTITAAVVRAETGFAEFPADEIVRAVKLAPLLTLAPGINPNYRSERINPVWLPDAPHYFNWVYRWLVEYNHFQLTKPADHYTAATTETPYYEQIRPRI